MNGWVTLAEVTPDELHVALDVPSHAAKAIYRWARDQDWPEGTELEKPADYHCSLLYSKTGSQWRENPWWIEHLDMSKAKVKGLESFGPSSKGYAYVLTIDSPEIQEHGQQMTDTALRMGLEVTFAEFKPHISIGYGPAKAEGIETPGFELHLGPSSISDPRQEEESKVSSLIGLASVLHIDFQRGSSVQKVTAKAQHLLSQMGYAPDDMNTQAAMQTWLMLHTADARQVEAGYGDDASEGALQHSGTMPDDQNLAQPPQLTGLNPHMGVQPSWLGTSGNTPVMVKPELRAFTDVHPNFARAERAAYSLSKPMGLNVPTTVVQRVNVPGVQGDPHLDMATHNTYGSVHQWIPNSRTVADQYDDGLDFDRFIKEQPEKARRIGLFDHIIGNNDRHLGNLLTDDTGNHYPIDHGASFRDESNRPYDPYYNQFYQAHQGQPLTPDEHQAVTNAYQHISSPEFQNIVSPAEAQHAMQRLEPIVKTGTFV
jgi:2'-5' RNA ligase